MKIIRGCAVLCSKYVLAGLLYLRAKVKTSLHVFKCNSSAKVKKKNVHASVFAFCERYPAIVFSSRKKNGNSRQSCAYLRGDIKKF